jgi:hypothetical protein
MAIAILIGAIEAAIGILYMAAFGHRSIARWIDDRRGQRYGVTEVTPESSSHPRLLTAESLRNYVEYCWRDPVEATLATGRALGIGSALVFGIAALMLLLGALTAGMVAFYTGDAGIADVATKMSVTGGDSLLGTALGVGLTFLALWLLDRLANEREIAQYESERENREQEPQQARTERRAAGQ